jgi:hypothetical protein
MKAKCAGYHGYVADVQKMRDTDPSGIVTNGEGKMPPYKTMRADQVKRMDALLRWPRR